MLHTIREIAFIGSDIPEGQTLISGIKKGIETAILDPNQDAIAQITQTLKGKKYSGNDHQKCLDRRGVRCDNWSECECDYLR